MGRPPRITEPQVAYHLLNRRVMRLTIFEKDADYVAFERVLAEGLDVTLRSRGRPRKRREELS